MIQQSLANEFRRRGMNRLAVTVVTQDGNGGLSGRHDDDFRDEFQDAG